MNNLKERYSSSPEPTKLMSIQNTGPTPRLFENNQNGFNYNRLKFNSNSSSGSNHSISSTSSGKSNHSGQVKNAITVAKVYVRMLDEHCDGYEKFKTLMITFEVDDGIQGVRYLILLFYNKYIKHLIF